MLRKMLGNVAAAVASDENAGGNPLLAQRPERRVLLVLVTSDKGLTGAFNTNLIKAGQRFIAERAGASVRMILVEHQGPRFLPEARRFGGRRAPQYGLQAGVRRRGGHRRQGHGALPRRRNRRLYLIYNEFKSVVAQTLLTSRVLPIELPEQASPADYIFEQSPAGMLDALLPRYVETEFYRALAESTAAEHAARMTAMEAATSNAGDMIEKLTLYMNRVRQASITKEIIEVVSGASSWRITKD